MNVIKSIKEFLMLWLAMMFFFLMAITGLALIFRKRLGWEDDHGWDWQEFVS